MVGARDDVRDRLNGGVGSASVLEGSVNDRVGEFAVTVTGC